MERGGVLTLGELRRLTRELPDDVEIHIENLRSDLANTPANRIVIVGETASSGTAMENTGVIICKI